MGRDPHQQQNPFRRDSQSSRFARFVPRLGTRLAKCYWNTSGSWSCYLPTHSLTRSSTYLLNYWFTYLLIHSLTYLPTYLLTYSPTYLPTDWLNYLLGCLLACSFVYLLRSFTVSVTVRWLSARGEAHIRRKGRLWNHRTNTQGSSLQPERLSQTQRQQRLGFLLLCSCDVFRALINSLVCWFCTSALGLVLFQIVKPQAEGRSIAVQDIYYAYFTKCIGTNRQGKN